jgi:RNA polymerase sigma factor (sigma-70 family)
MSPRSVRRYRADKLLRREFEATRAPVLAVVRRRLRSAGVKLDDSDLEACYAQAWHGLYMTMLAGEVEIANTAGWLTLVTYRRALDEHRAHTRACGSGGHQLGEGASAYEADRAHDPADALEQRARLRQLLEGLRGRLGPRERQAAALCYLQGLSRADAAARMGISQARMRKLMDGPRPGSPGVAAKMGELLQAIRAGSYCDEQASLMRGLAFGILDPAGERYMLAQAHSRECPACRAYVLTLRGLAAVLPPLPLPLALGAGAAAGAGAGAGSGAGAAAGSGAGAGSGTCGAGAATGGAGAVGAAGVGVTGGGWLVASGGLGAKLAAGCLLTMTVGFGCAAFTIGPPGPAHRSHRQRALRAGGSGAAAGSIADLSPPAATVRPSTSTSLPSAGSGSLPGSGSGSGWGSGSAGADISALMPAAQASREFGPEQPAGGASGQWAEAAAGSASARTASASSGGGAGSRQHARRPRTAGRGGAGAGAPSPSGVPSSSAADASSDSPSFSGTGESVAADAPSESGSGSAGQSSGSGSTGESAAANPGPPSAAEREFGI